MINSNILTDAFFLRLSLNSTPFLLLQRFVVIKPTATDRDPEHKLAYFREDIGINLHHWHWHLVYPLSTVHPNSGIVNKDRRGELFYYMHHQILAR